MAHVSRGKVYNEGGHILQPGDTVTVKMVTAIGHSGDFAVYQGLPDQADQEVAAYGDKLSEKAGRAVAPYCAHLKYRR